MMNKILFARSQVMYFDVQNLLLALRIQKKQKRNGFYQKMRDNVVATQNSRCLRVIFSLLRYSTSFYLRKTSFFP